MSAKVNKVIVHMSQDAKSGRKLASVKRRTSCEYTSDYSKAVEEGRRLSNEDPNPILLMMKIQRPIFRLCCRWNEG